MSAKPRSDVLKADEVGLYHCSSRLVRGCHLSGWDPLTGRDYSYRLDWVRDRFRELAGSMAIDVWDYAVLGVRLHLVLRNRPDVVRTWPDEEVARRWWYVCPPRKDADGSIPAPNPCEIGRLLQGVDQYRRRLSDISWMMRLACQKIALRANREDGVGGRFFDGGFDCEELKTAADVLACSIYVDLNWIHAGPAETPQEQYRSVFDQIHARWREVCDEMGSAESLPALDATEAWLPPNSPDDGAPEYSL